MSAIAYLNISLSFNQIVDLIKQLPKTQQEKLLSLIQEQQMELLDKRSKTAIDKYIPAKDSLKQLKKRYDL